MRTPRNPYTDKELAAIDAAAQQAMESLAAKGEYLPYETHRQMAELAFLMREIEKLGKMITKN